MDDNAARMDRFYKHFSRNVVRDRMGRAMTERLHISQDGEIRLNGNYIGYLDDEDVYVIERGEARKIGTFEHRAEATTIVTKWLAGDIL